MQYDENEELYTFRTTGLQTWTDTFLSFQNETSPSKSSIALLGAMAQFGTSFSAILLQNHTKLTPAYSIITGMPIHAANNGDVDPGYEADDEWEVEIEWAGEQTVGE